MIEKPGKQSDIMTVPSGQEIAEKFSARFPSFKCSVCAAEDFVVLDRFEEGFSSQYLIHKANDPQIVRYTNLLGIACQNCGHVYQFALDILKRRLEEN